MANTVSWGVRIAEEVTEILEKLPLDYQPKLDFDPYEEDVCGSYQVMEINNSGVGVTIHFCDGSVAFIADDGEFAFERKGKEC